jgi:hypothetical protein
MAEVIDKQSADLRACPRCGRVLGPTDDEPAAEKPPEGPHPLAGPMFQGPWTEADEIWLEYMTGDFRDEQKPRDSDL